jgi:HTH-type transcriptional regulator, bacterioopsin transcriptional activator and related proteins
MLGPPDASLSLEELFEQSSDAVFITDPHENRILDANAAATRLLGYTRDEFVVTPISQIHPHELPRLRAFLDGALRDGVNWTIEMTCRTKSGTFLPTEIALLALDSGNRVYVLSLVRDRSEHRG